MVTLASIVEKETGKTEERPRVAGVFINRLDKHMRLGSDPTIVYGLVQGKGTLGRSITKADLNQPTPYNTYLIDGLPPGPICNPGKAALEAVAKPARSKDLYFVADGTGGHAFAETLDQHQKNVARWRQIEKDVKDKLAPDVTGPAIRGSIDEVDPSQFGELVSPGQGQAPASMLARLGKIGADRNAKDGSVARHARRQIDQGNRRPSPLAPKFCRQKLSRAGTETPGLPLFFLAAVWRARRAGAGTRIGLGSRPSQQDRHGPERQGCGARVPCRSGREDDRGIGLCRLRRQRCAGGRPRVRERRPAGNGQEEARSPLLRSRQPCSPIRRRAKPNMERER